MNTIDITNPVNRKRFVGKDNYVSYLNKWGILSFPVTATIDSGCGFWGTEHFKVDADHIKLEMGEGDRKATLIENSDKMAAILKI